MKKIISLIALPFILQSCKHQIILRETKIITNTITETIFATNKKNTPPYSSFPFSTLFETKHVFDDPYKVNGIKVKGIYLPLDISTPSGGIGFKYSVDFKKVEKCYAGGVRSCIYVEDILYPDVQEDKIYGKNGLLKKHEICEGVIEIPFSSQMAQDEYTNAFLILNSIE